MFYTDVTNNQNERQQKVKVQVYEMWRSYTIFDIFE